MKSTPCRVSAYGPGRDRDEVAEHWGRKNAIRRVPVINALMAATAKANGLILVTRNVADVAGLDVDVLNPFEA